MKRIIKIGLWSLCIVVVICIALLLICNQIVVSNAKGRCFSDVDSIVPTRWGLLLGTTPQTRIGNRQNMFFKYRIDAAEDLYREGKVELFLISGDENSLDGVNEPQCMKDSLVARGVPTDIIFLDGKGFRTLDSVVRACKIFGVKSFVIISQRFHNERALYLSEHLGLDVDDLQAYNAISPNTGLSFITYAREYLARVKLFWDILSDKQPKLLGKEKPLESMILERKKSDQEFWRSINSVKGHDEQDTIVGNFTGNGIDTLFVCYGDNKENGDKWQFYAKSSNKMITRLNLWGFWGATPKLVNVGDLDGNGTCEVGYLHTWMNSQWRTYRVFTFLNGKWRYLIDPEHEYMETGDWIRASGKDIVEPSDKKGWIKVNYQTQGVGALIRDTVVKPDYSPIDD